ncbi:MAG: lipoyl domain-containing protein, partial [Anaerolineales bacterium]
MSINSFSVKIPLLNPNEPEAKLVFLAIEEGQYVKQGDVLCTLETTKSTADLIAEWDGYVKNLVVSEGDLVKAGSQFCFLAENENWQPDTGTNQNLSASELEVKQDIPTGLRISKPALILAQS